jgi:hypothetical protein
MALADWISQQGQKRSIQMIYIPPILELSLYGVVDAGVPNRERICVRPTDSINLAQFGILAGIRAANGAITPSPNLFFWFGDLVVTPPAWLIVFTGKGESPSAPLVENGNNVYVFYWNLKNTIFNIPGMSPIVFKMNTILTGYNVPAGGAKQIANQ